MIRRPHLDRPSLSQSVLGGAAQQVSQVLGGVEPTGRAPGPAPLPVPPRPGHWPQSSGAWPSWGWGRLRWPPALLSASLLWLRARRPGWLGFSRVPAPAPAPTMGNSHHKRKAPSGPRARSFWRFGRSAKRPAGRGWEWGRGRRGGGSPSRSRRRRCCPLPGLDGCECGGGRESPAQTPPLTCTQRHMYARIPTGRHGYMFRIYTVTYITPTPMYRHAEKIIYTFTPTPSLWGSQIL